MNSKENGKQFKGSSSYENDGEPIDPVTVVFDKDSNFLFMGNDGDKDANLHTINNKMVWIVEEDGEKMEKVMKKMSGSDIEIITIEGDEEKELTTDEGKKIIKIKKGRKGDDNNVFIIKKDGDTDSDVKIISKKVIVTDGEHVEIHEGDGKLLEIYEQDGEPHKKHIKVIKSKKGGDSNVFIMKDSDDDEDIEVIHEEGSSFFFIDKEDGEKPLYILDGKEVKEKKFKGISPDNIATINVYKGDKAVEKYGKKAKDGVVEITTKKNKK
jgi:hypothetical protein